VIVVGPVFTIETSAEAVTVAVVLDELFPGFESIVVDDTVAVLVAELPFGVLALVLYVAVIVAVCPLLSVPRLHGNAVVHAPELDTNVSPGGAVSLTDTPAALLGPLLAT
jgi:hypothetical protein